MPVGHTSYVMECQTSPSYTLSVAPCLDVNGSFYQPVMVNSYVIEPTSQTYFEGMAQPFDYTLASQYFAFAFTGVFVMSIFGLICGKVIGPIWGK